MPVPTLDKTWQFNLGMASGGLSDLGLDGHDAMLKVKNALLGFALSPWTVWGSSNAGSFGNNDGVDRWATTANLTWVSSSGNHSWIVLKQTGLGVNACMCIDLLGDNNLFARNIHVYWMPTGPDVSGTLSARPTAVNEVLFPNNTFYWYQGSSGNTAGRWQIMMSTDGECTRLLVGGSFNMPSCYWFIEKVKNPVAGWTYPVVCGLFSGATLDYVHYNDNNTYCAGWTGKVCNFYMTSEGWGTAAAGEQMTFPDDDTGEWPFSPINLACDDAGGRGANKGTLFDLWWGSTAQGTPTTYPEDNSLTFVQLDDLIFPWDGTFPWLQYLY